MLSRTEDSSRSHQVIHVVLKNVGKGHVSDRYFFNGRLKERFKQQLHRFLGIYRAINLISFCSMDSHIHLIFRCDQDYNFSRAEVVRFYFDCYGKDIDPNGEKCRELQKHLNDISKFVQRFARDFTIYFNGELKKKGYKRTGALWVPRFYSSELKQGKDLINCWIYNMLNPVRARMVTDPMQYRFSSLTLSDEDALSKVDRNFYETYLLLTGEQLSFAQFKTKVLNLLKRALLILLAEFELVSADSLHLLLASVDSSLTSQIGEIVTSNSPDN